MFKATLKQFYQFLNQWIAKKTNLFQMFCYWFGVEFLLWVAMFFFIENIFYIYCHFVVVKNLEHILKFIYKNRSKFLNVLDINVWIVCSSLTFNLYYFFNNNNFYKLSKKKCVGALLKSIRKKKEFLKVTGKRFKRNNLK